MCQAPQHHTEKRFLLPHHHRILWVRHYKTRLEYQEYCTLKLCTCTNPFGAAIFFGVILGVAAGLFIGLTGFGLALGLNALGFGAGLAPGVDLLTDAPPNEGFAPNDGFLAKMGAVLFAPDSWSIGLGLWQIGLLSSRDLLLWSSRSKSLFRDLAVGLARLAAAKLGTVLGLSVTLFLLACIWLVLLICDLKIGTIFLAAVEGGASPPDDGVVGCWVLLAGVYWECSLCCFSTDFGA